VPLSKEDTKRIYEEATAPKNRNQGPPSPPASIKLFGTVIVVVAVVAVVVVFESRPLNQIRTMNNSFNELLN